MLTNHNLHNLKSVQELEDKIAILTELEAAQVKLIELLEEKLQLLALYAS